MRYIVRRDADLKSASYLTVNHKRSPHQYKLVELRLRVGSTGESRSYCYLFDRNTYTFLSFQTILEELQQRLQPTYGTQQAETTS
jgi:hypothetical protein